MPQHVERLEVYPCEMARTLAVEISDLSRPQSFEHTSKSLCMLTIKLELVQPDGWFTTTDLKDAYFHIVSAPKWPKMAVRWPTKTTGPHSTTYMFSKCVKVLLQPMQDGGMRVYHCSCCEMKACGSFPI